VPHYHYDDNGTAYLKVISRQKYVGRAVSQPNH